MATEALRINWRRLFVEGAAIVVSILLAFGVDAWWQDRLDRQHLHNGLANLQAELRSNIERLDQYQQRHQGIVDAGVELLSADPGELTSKQFGQVFFDGWVTDYSTGALDIVLGSLRLDLIEDQQLRADLAALPAGYEDALEDERWAIQQLMGKWVPYASSVFPVASMWSVALPGVEFPVTDEWTPASVAPLVPTLEFRNHVTNRIGFELLSIVAQRELRGKLEAVIERIDAVVE